MGISPDPIEDLSIIWDHENSVLDLHDEIEEECAENPDTAKPAAKPYAPSQEESRKKILGST